MLTIPCQITATSIDDGLLTLGFKPWQNASTSVRVPIATPDKAANAEGQRLLSGICRKLGIMKLDDDSQFMGRTLTLKLAQTPVAAGIQSTPVVVEVITC